MNKKRALSILVAAAMAAGTLATSVPVYADDVEEITWMFWDDLEATEDLISKGYKEVIDRFNEEYDGKYHVTPITTNLEEYDGKLNALIAAGQTPDVYICNPGPNMDVYVNAGAAAVMPLGSPIGSNKGICTKDFIQILIDEIDLPIIVDAGIGKPSQACEAMEMGAAAVMANTAIATAGDIPAMAEAFKKAIEAGRSAYLAGLGRVIEKGSSASSPLTGFLED